MNPVVDLSPLGTARVGAKNASSLAGDEEALLAWLGPVRERLASAFAIEEEVVFLAWEVARWPVGLEVEERQALALLALTALVALRQGSTRLPLRGEEGRAVRLDLARRLVDDTRAGPGLDAARAVDVADALIDSGRAERGRRCGGGIQAVGRRRVASVPPEDARPGEAVRRLSLWPDDRVRPGMGRASRSKRGARRPGPACHPRGDADPPVRQTRSPRWKRRCGISAGGDFRRSGHGQDDDRRLDPPGAPPPGGRTRGDGPGRSRPARRRTAWARPCGRDSKPSQEPLSGGPRPGEPGRSADASQSARLFTFDRPLSVPREQPACRPRRRGGRGVDDRPGVDGAACPIAPRRRPAGPAGRRPPAPVCRGGRRAPRLDRQRIASRTPRRAVDRELPDARRGP